MAHQRHNLARSAIFIMIGYSMHGIVTAGDLGDTSKTKVTLSRLREASNYVLPYTLASFPFSLAREYYLAKKNFERPRLNTLRIARSSVPVSLAHFIATYAAFKYEQLKRLSSGKMD